MKKKLCHTYPHRLTYRGILFILIYYLMTKFVMADFTVGTYVPTRGKWEIYFKNFNQENSC
jgi:hypothetical protein